MNDDVLHYRSILAYNREIFLIEHGNLIKIFDAVDRNFFSLIKPLQTMRDNSRKSYVSIIPFVSLLQRQSRVAFEAFASFQSYQGWVVLRPGIEAVLIVGKWMDDPANATIWKHRHQDPKGYRNTYQGTALRSNSLSGSEKIQRVLSRVNDDFVHANPDYYSRHLKIEPGDPGFVNLRVEYFDEDELQTAHVIAFLHLLLVMQDSLANMLASLFGSPVNLKPSLRTFQAQFGTKIEDLASKSEDIAAIFRYLGAVTSIG